MNDETETAKTVGEPDPAAITDATRPLDKRTKAELIEIIGELQQQVADIEASTLTKDLIAEGIELRRGPHRRIVVANDAIRTAIRTALADMDRFLQVKMHGSEEWTAHPAIARFRQQADAFYEAVQRECFPPTPEGR